LAEIVDKHNHCWDAIRYGLGPLIKKGGAEAFLSYLASQKSSDATQTSQRHARMGGTMIPLGIQRPH
jgi:hypothetical protein